MRTIRRDVLGAAVGLALLAGLSVPAPLSAQDPELSFGECGLSGVVRDEGSELPLPGATVTLRYQEVQGQPTPEPITVQADDQGRYQICGLVPFREVSLRASYSVVRSDERRFELDRPQERDLEIDLGDSAFLVFSVVAAEDGRPIEGARIEFSPIPVAGITDSLGRVAFRAIPPGTYDMHVEHIAFAPRDEEISVLTEQVAEMRIEMVTRAIAVEPIAVQVTGRDPYLLTSGFYERRQSIEDGYFGTHAEIEGYLTLGTLFRYKRELSIRYNRNRIILLNGRPAGRLGFRSTRELSELKYSRVRGIEAYPCFEAPPEILNQVPGTSLLGDCNIVAIWTR